MVSPAKVKKKIFFSGQWFSAVTLVMEVGASAGRGRVLEGCKIALLLEGLVTLHSCFNSFKCRIPTWKFNRVPPLLLVICQEDP